MRIVITFLLLIAMLAGSKAPDCHIEDAIKQQSLRGIASLRSGPALFVAIWQAQPPSASAQKLQIWEVAEGSSRLRFEVENAEAWQSVTAVHSGRLRAFIVLSETPDHWTGPARVIALVDGCVGRVCRIGRNRGHQQRRVLRGNRFAVA
jgi:hypothetical protein